MIPHSLCFSPGGGLVGFWQWKKISNFICLKKYTKQADTHSVPHKVRMPSIEHYSYANLHLSGCTAGLVVKNGHQKDMCYNEIGLCAQNKDSVLGSLINRSGRVYVIAQRERRIFTLTSCTFASQHRYWRFVTRNLLDSQLLTGMRQFTISSNSQKCTLSRKCPL